MKSLRLTRGHGPSEKRPPDTPVWIGFVTDETKIQIIGIGDDGLEGVTEAARRMIEQADLIIGASPMLALLPTSTAERLELDADLGGVVERLRSASSDQRIVVLASGDPLFYGTARYLCTKLGKERFEVLPHVSSMQLAFARVKESWEEAYLTDLSRRPLESILDRVRIAEKVGLFTSDEQSPSAVAQTLLDHQLDYFTAYVCENLGSPDERVTNAELRDLIGQTFAPLNVMILIRKPDVPDRPQEAIGHRLFGNPDDAFLQSKPKHGLLTPAEVRAMALAEMDLGARSTVWDVGAGSGSVAIEAAQLAHDGTTYAIEMDPEDHGLIVENAERLGVTNLVSILGRAPDAWNDLPDPDAIFVGGSGREVRRIVELAYARLRSGGRLVANVGSIQNLAEVHDLLVALNSHVKVWMINVARGTPQMERIRFDALNPTFLVAVVKPQ